MATLNVTGVKNGLRTLITGNESTILAGITHQGQARTLAQVTRSNLTPALADYFVGIFVPRSFTRSQRQSNLRRPSDQAVYVVQIEVYDNAEIQSGDTEAYEVMHLDFSTIYSRLINIIKAQNRVTTDPCTELLRLNANDRLVTVLDVSSPKRDAVGNLWAQLGCLIQFTLVDNTI